MDASRSIPLPYNEDLDQLSRSLGMPQTILSAQTIPARLLEVRRTSKPTQTPSQQAKSDDLQNLERRSDQPEAREVIRRAISQKKVRVLPDCNNPERVRLIPVHDPS